MENSIEASDSWYETSCKNYPQYWICDGDHLLNWKNNGYATVFDLLQVHFQQIKNERAHILNQN